VRWTQAPHDGELYFDASQIFLYLFFWPALFGALGASAFSSLRTAYEAVRSRRRLWAYTVTVGSVFQCAQLLIANPASGFHFWWPAPETDAPLSSIWLFQISRVVLWFLTPYLLYWLALLVRRLWQKRRGLSPDTSAAEEPHAG
jgi:hypothetical protein